MEGSDNPIHKGNQAFIDEDYPATLQAYGEAISLGGEGEALARSNRAAVYLKLSKHTEALQDASAAVKLMPTEMAFYRKGLAAFALEEFETALEAFRQGKKLEEERGDSNDPRKYRTWVRKCEAELEAEEEAHAAAAASSDRSMPPTTPTTTTTTSDVAPVSGGSVGAAAAPVKRTPVPASSTAPAHLRIKFQYYQSYEKVTVAVLEKGLKESEVKVDVEAKRLTVRRKAGDNAGALLFDKVLYEEVLPEKCRTRFMASKLEVTMTKKSPADWPELEGAAIPAARPAAAATATDASSTSGEAAVEQPPTKVARPYSSTKDWDVVEKEVQKELEAEKPGGEQALNDLFKSIYGKADEDTRRAMVKSFQTSGGTVLSTNWDEVGKADYEKERQAPKGMEWKTWEGEKLPQKEDDDN
ncbi:SGT1 homologue [Ectocarpus siliculosus]|uniref:SGT1 homologue n=1 Tax=Ectocarpus siliculosus TaxID=2880 RepID=D8LF07_ECTSI|nr:SGT1 homologue [Ectocarpus siliculosus]|eukprot:CBN79827.1 SGT1 homologue [Ectocarpus siliculosus]